MKKKQQAKQGIYHGNRYEPPRGLTVEQAEDQRVGTHIDERQTREAGRGEREASSVMPRGDKHAPPADGAEANQPYGKRQR